MFTIKSKAYDLLPSEIYDVLERYEKEVECKEYEDFTFEAKLTMYTIYFKFD